MGTGQTQVRVRTLDAEGNVADYRRSQQNCTCVRVQLKCDGTRWRREGKWSGNWLMEWVASTLHTTSEHGVSGITTTVAYNSAASSWLNWRPCRFKWTRSFRRMLVSARVPSHFKRSLPLYGVHDIQQQGNLWVLTGYFFLNFVVFWFITS
jgi:hypothetical protein